MTNTKTQSSKGIGVQWQSTHHERIQNQKKRERTRKKKGGRGREERKGEERRKPGGSIRGESNDSRILNSILNAVNL